MSNTEIAIKLWMFIYLLLFQQGKFNQNQFTNLKLTYRPVQGLRRERNDQATPISPGACQTPCRCNYHACVWIARDHAHAK